MANTSGRNARSTNTRSSTRSRSNTQSAPAKTGTDRAPRGWRAIRSEISAQMKNSADPVLLCQTLLSYSRELMAETKQWAKDQRQSASGTSRSASGRGTAKRATATRTRRASAAQNAPSLPTRRATTRRRTQESELPVLNGNDAETGISADI